MTITGSIILAVLALFILGIIVAFVARRKDEPSNDPRINLRPNDTNYNIASNRDEVIENATPQEAREIKDKLDKSDLSSLSNEDFYRLKEKV